MSGFAADIVKITTDNTHYRQVVYTSHYSQLVLMHLKPGEDISNEIHGLDQFIRIEEGSARVTLNNGGTVYDLEKNWAVIVPAGTYHHVVNTGEGGLKLSTLYSPPDHLKDTVQATKADEKEDHFDGVTTE